MIHTSLAQVLAAEHIQAAQHDAARRRLATLASCCRPSYLAQRLAALRERLAARTTAQACCA